MGILDRNKVKLHYDFDAQATLRCPISGKIISKNHGDEEKFIAYGRIKPVLFSLISPAIGWEDHDYFRKDFRTKIKELRKSLGRKVKDLSNYDLLAEYFDDWPSNIMVFEITLDRMHGQCHYIGIDLGPESLEDES